MSDQSAVLFMEDVARELRTSVRTIKKLRKYRAFPIPELPAIDKRPRWSRDAVQRYLSNQPPGRLRRVG